MDLVKPKSAHSYAMIVRKVSHEESLKPWSGPNPRVNWGLGLILPFAVIDVQILTLLVVVIQDKNFNILL